MVSRACVQKCVEALAHNTDRREATAAASQWTPTTLFVNSQWTPTTSL